MNGESYPPVNTNRVLAKDPIAYRNCCNSQRNGHNERSLSEQNKTKQNNIIDIMQLVDHSQEKI